MKKGFVYPPSHAPRGGAQPRKDSGRCQLQFQRSSSPRKRKRSPETHLPATGQLPAAGPSDERQTKVQRQVQPISVEEGDDYLDELGAAALEQYELTQREREPSPSPPHPVPHIQAGRAISAGQTASGSSIQKASHSQMGQPVSSWEQQQKALHEGGSSSSAEKGQYMERIKHLEEQSYKRDGEVKVLRTELGKKDEQFREMHSKFLSEQKVKEEQFLREKKSLSTQLQFKEQELAALRERCASLEQRQKQQSGSQSSPLPHSRPPQKQAMSEGLSRGKQRSEFPSTETFMPLSQMSSSDVIPVHVAQKRRHSRAQTTKSASPEAMDARQAPPTRPSPSQSPSRRAGKSAEPAEDHLAASGSSSAPSGKGSRSLKSQKSSHSATARSKSSPSSEHAPLHLCVPPLKMSSRDFLMLLFQGDLLKLPSLDVETDSPADGAGQSDAKDAPSASLESSLSPALQEASSSLPGLLSLLHIPHSPSPSSSSSPFPSSMTTPVSTPRAHLPLSSSSSLSPSTSSHLVDLSSDSLPRTPIRKSKLQLHHKPHTCAHTDMTKSRTRLAQDDFPLRKALSASNTPLRGHTASAESEATVSNSLVDSVNVDSLQKNILALLRAGDSSKVSSMFSVESQYNSSHLGHTPFSGLGILSSYGDADDSPCVETQLLLNLGDIVVCYVTDQMEKARASVMSGPNASSHLSDLDSADTQSPKSSLGSSSVSSRGSSEMSLPSKADQSFLCRCLGLLETVVTYSKLAREQLTAPPPPVFEFDDVTPSALETKLEQVQRSRLAEEEEEEEEEGEDSMAVTGDGNGTSKPQTAEWRGMVLEQMGTGRLSKVWVPQGQQPKSELPHSKAMGWRSSSVSLSVTPHDMRLRRGGRGGQLLSALLQLVTPPWKESNDVVLLSLRILSLVAKDCSLEQLERFSLLLDQDGLETYLDRDDPDSALCLASLSLLTSLVRSPNLTQLLCCQRACLLQVCYDYFTRSDTVDAETTFKTQLQLVRLVSGILVVRNGPAVLFESSCNCCHELLKSVANLAQSLVQDVHCWEDLSHSSTVLLSALVVLLHKISLCDRYFDSHREECKFSFIFSIRTLYWLFKDNPAVSQNTKYVLNELFLEYGEDLEDTSCEDEEEAMEN